MKTVHAFSHYLPCALSPHQPVDRQVRSEHVQSMTWSLETLVGAEGVMLLDLITDSQVSSLNSSVPRGTHSRKWRCISSVVIHVLSSSWSTHTVSRVLLLHLTRLAVLVPLHVYTFPLSNNFTAPAKFISSSCPARCHHPMLSFPRTPLLLLCPLFLRLVFANS